MPEPTKKQIMARKLGAAFQPTTPEHYEAIERAVAEIPEPAPTVAPIKEPALVDVEGITDTEAPLDIPTLPIEPVVTVQSAEEIVTQEQAKVATPAEETQTDLSTRILQLTKDIGGREVEEARLEEQEELPELSAELDQVSSQINDLALQGLDLQNQAKIIPSLIEQQFEGRGATKAGIAPITAGELRKNALQQSAIASQALTLQSQAFALQGQYSIARQKVDRAIDLKYTPKENEIKFLLTAMELNRDFLDREDKERAILLQARLADRQEQINFFKEQEKTTQDRLFDITQGLREANAPASLIRRVLNAPDEFAAQAIAGEFIPQPSALDVAKLETERARGEKIRTETEILREEIETSDETPIQAITRMKNEGRSRAEVNAFLDAETTFDKSSRDDLLDEVFGEEEREIPDDVLDGLADQFVDAVKSIWKGKNKEFSNAQFLIDKNRTKQKWSQRQVDVITQKVKEKLKIE